MACSDWDLYVNALDAGNMAVRDAILCPFQDSMGGMVFATIVIVGIIGLPIYARQQSIIIPFVLVMILGGILLTQIVAMGQMLIAVVVLLVLGAGPVILLRRRVR